MKRLSACIIALLLNSSLFILKGLADDVTITVQTPTTIEAGDQFRVRFTISSQNVSNFNAPDFKDLQLHARAVFKSSMVEQHKAVLSPIPMCFWVLSLAPIPWILPQRKWEEKRWNPNRCRFMLRSWDKEPLLGLISRLKAAVLPPQDALRAEL